MDKAQTATDFIWVKIAKDVTGNTIDGGRWVVLYPALWQGVEEPHDYGQSLKVGAQNDSSEPIDVDEDQS